MAQFFGSVIVDVNADQVERSVVARGDVVIPSMAVEEVLAQDTVSNEETTDSGITDGDAAGSDVVDETDGSSESDVATEKSAVIGNTKEQTVSVEFPVVWKEDGQVVVHFPFEFNDNVIEIHQPEETCHSGKHSKVPQKRRKKTEKGIHMQTESECICRYWMQCKVHQPRHL